MDSECAELDYICFIRLCFNYVWQGEQNQTISNRSDNPENIRNFVLHNLYKENRAPGLTGNETF
jgi:hypothetical protein